MEKVNEVKPKIMKCQHWKGGKLQPNGTLPREPGWGHEAAVWTGHREDTNQLLMSAISLRMASGAIYLLTLIWSDNFISKEMR